MIIFDTETTNLVKSTEAPIRVQPKMIEFFGIAVMASVDKLPIIGELHLMIDPQEPITEEITKITSITDDMVRGMGVFPVHLPELQKFFLASQIICAHNLTFDLEVLEVELKRIDAVTRFPWPPLRLCTVEATEHLAGRRLGLTDLHRRLFDGAEFEGAHRAKEDVMALHRCLQELLRRGEIELPRF